jgi:hypothetical protein
MKLINKTLNGQIAYCSHHKMFHLEFGNLMFHLTYVELKKFSNYVNSIDYEFYLEKNKKANNKRKLLLDLGFNNIFFCLHASEFTELKDLLSLKKDTYLTRNTNIIDFNITLN